MLILNHLDLIDFDSFVSSTKSICDSETGLLNIISTDILSHLTQTKHSNYGGQHSLH